MCSWDDGDLRNCELGLCDVSPAEEQPKKYWNQRWCKLIILNGVLFWRTFHQFNKAKESSHKRWGDKKIDPTNSQCRETATGAHDVSSRKRSALSEANCPSAPCGFCLLLLFSSGARVSCRLAGGRTDRSYFAAAHYVSSVHTLVCCVLYCKR